MVKHLNDIFCYERGRNIRLSIKNKKKALGIAKEIAQDLSIFIESKKWNNLPLKVNTDQIEITGEETGMVILEIGIDTLGQNNSMKIIDAISDIEDIIDAAIHQIEDFDGVYISLKIAE